MKKVFVLFAILLTFSGCNNKIKETIGIVTPGPNEYLVKRNKPLEVPPHYELPLVKKTTDKGGNKGTAASLNAGEEALIEEVRK